MQMICDQYKPPVLYGMIISFDHDFAVKNQIIDKRNMDKLIAKSMNSILKKMNLEPDNVIWTSSFIQIRTIHIVTLIFTKRNKLSENRLYLNIR